MDQQDYWFTSSWYLFKSNSQIHLVAQKGPNKTKPLKLSTSDRQKGKIQGCRLSFLFFSHTKKKKLINVLFWVIKNRHKYFKYILSSDSSQITKFFYTGNQQSLEEKLFMYTADAKPIFRSLPTTGFCPLQEQVTRMPSNTCGRTVQVSTG